MGEGAGEEPARRRRGLRQGGRRGWGKIERRLARLGDDEACGIQRLHRATVAHDAQRCVERPAAAQRHLGRLAAEQRRHPPRDIAAIADAGRAAKAGIDGDGGHFVSAGVEVPGPSPTISSTAGSSLAPS